MEGVAGALNPILEHRYDYSVCHYLAIPSFLSAYTESSLGVYISDNKALGAIFNFSEMLKGKQFASLLTVSVGRAEHPGSDPALKNPSHFSTMPLWAGMQVRHPCSAVPTT